jgi:hypothetical protein
MRRDALCPSSLPRLVFLRVRLDISGRHAGRRSRRRSIAERLSALRPRRIGVIVALLESRTVGGRTGVGRDHPILLGLGRRLVLSRLHLESLRLSLNPGTDGRRVENLAIVRNGDHGEEDLQASTRDQQSKAAW